MKKIIISVTILLSTFMYSQELQLMETLCKVEVWNNDSSRFESNKSYGSCYGFYEGRDKQDSMILALVDINNTNSVTYYKVYEEMGRKFLHWTYRVRDLNLGQECYFHHIRTGDHNMVRVDYNYYIIRFIDEH